MNLRLRKAETQDAPECGRICYDAFKTIAEQHRFPPDFPSVDAAIGLINFLVENPAVYSVVAERDGRVVGSNFLWENGAIAGVGPITVEPGVQNAQAGRALMQDVMRCAQERKFSGVRLVQAAYHNRSLSLYTKLGFDVREPLSTLQGAPLRMELPGFPVRTASEADLAACNALCLRVHGHERAIELRGAIGQGTASLVERNGRVTAYATLVGFFGHAVAETNDDLKALIGAAQEFPGPGFLLPTRNAEVLRWCLGQGLRVIQPMSLMSLGLYNEPAGAFLPSILF